MNEVDDIYIQLLRMIKLQSDQNVSPFLLRVFEINLDVVVAPFIIIQMKLCACISSYFKMRNIFLEWQQEWGLLLSILKVQTCSIIQASIGQAATLSQLGRKTQNFLQTWRTVKLCQKTWANQSWDKDKKDNNNTFQT